jgi:arylsulfatase A-like enzyme
MDRQTQSLSRRQFLATCAAAGASASLLSRLLAADDAPAPDATRPNLVLCMTDDQGWGDTSYNGNKFLKTPNLDAMAAAGLRFDDFYAAAPVCSPTRGSVLTGRHPNRFGCFTFGKPIRRQEMTIARAVKQAGYRTGHFGKWHLNGVSGPGKPIAAKDPLNPGAMGFDEWLSVSNYFDLNPVMSRNGEPVQCTGDGSDVIMEEALRFIGDSAKRKTPFLAVIWYGSPHSPHKALEKDKQPYANLSARQQNYYGELAAVDRSMGRLRAELRTLGIAQNTLVWFCSDNGGAFGSTSTGGLRGGKATLWEGGVRVPGILEWPARIARPAVTDCRCSTLDIYPTLVDLLGLRVAGQIEPIDGVSLAPLLAGRMAERPRPMPFWVHGDGAALIDGSYKLHVLQPAGRPGQPPAAPAVQLYDLAKDPKETTDLAAAQPDRVAAMKATLEAWQTSVENSLAGKDYPAPSPQ